MAIDILQTLEVIELMENYISFKRPPLEIRHKVDLSYKIEDQSIIVFEIRPLFSNPFKKTESPIAKTTFVKSKNHWKVFWFRSDLNWHGYQPEPTVKSLEDFINPIDEDIHHCFWG